MANVLDENVVILKFDNSDFKKNTADSVKSIENLKTSLRNADSGETLSNIGKAANSINLSGFDRAITTINKRFSTMGIVGMAAINKLTSSAMSSVTNLMKAVPNQLIQGGWKRALNIEQASFLMKGLGYEFEGTYDKITKKFEGIKGAVLASVDDTAYGLDEAAKVAATFMASGITDANELARRLKAVSGVAAVTSSDYASLGRIFAQVAGQGRMMGDDLNQLSDKGFNAAQEIVKYLNANKDVKDSALEAAISAGRQVKAMKEIQTHAEITEADVRQMVSAGAISFDIMSSSLEHFFDTAQEANKTYTGSFANVKAALSRMGAQLEEPKMKNMTRIFNTLLPILKQLETFIEPFTKKIAAAGDKVTDFINEGILNPLATAIGVDPSKLFHGFASEVKKAGDESKDAGDKTKDLGDKIRVTAKEWQAALDIWNKGTYGTDQKRVDSIRALGMSYENVQGIINKFYKNKFDWEKTKKDYVIGSEKEQENNEKTSKTTEEVTDRIYQQTKTLSTLGKVIQGTVNIAKAFMNTLKAIKNIGTVAWNTFKNFTKTLGGAFSNAFLRISYFILDLSQKFLDFTELLKKGNEGIVVAFEKYPLLASLFMAVAKVASFFGNILRAVVEQIRDVFNTMRKSSALSRLEKSFVALGNTISRFVWDKIRKIEEAFSNIAKIAKDNTGIKSLGDIFSKIVDSIGDFITALAGGERVSGSFFSALGAFANNVISLLSPVVNWVIDIFGSAIQTLIEFFKELGESEGIKLLKESISDLIDTMFKVDAPLGNVVTWLHNLSNASETGGLDKVVNFFSNVAKGLSDFVIAVANGQSPLELFVGVFKKVKDSLSVGGVVDYLKNTIGYAAGQDLSVMFSGMVNTLSNIRDFLIQIGALKGLTDGAIYVVNSLSTLFNYFKDYPWSELFNKVKGYNWESISKVILTLTGAFAIFKSTMDFGKLVQSASGMFNAIGGMFKSIGGIANTIQQSIKASTFAILAVSIAILIGAIIALALVPAEKSKQALKTVGIIMTALSIIVLATSTKHFSPEAMRSLGIAFVGVGTGILLIASSMMLIARLNATEIIKAGGVILGFMLVITLISSKAKALAGSGMAFIELAVALNLLVTAIVGLALIPYNMLIKGGTIILGFMVALAASAKIANSSKTSGFISMAIALNLLIPAIVMLALIPTHMLVKGGAAVVGLMLALGKASEIAGRGSSTRLSRMAAVIAVLAASCLVLSFIDPVRLLSSATAISEMMLALGVAAKGASKGMSVKTMFEMIAIIAAVAGAIALVAKIAPDNAASIGLSMAATIASIGGVLAVFAKLKINPAEVTAAATGLAEGVAIVAGIMTALAGSFALIGAAIEKIGGPKAAQKISKWVGDISGILGTMIGSFIAPIRDALVNGMSDGPSLAESFNQTIDSVGSMLEAAGKLKPEQLSSLTHLARALKDVGKANLYQGLSNLVGDGKGPEISTKMEELGTGLVKLRDAIKDVSDEDITKAYRVTKIFAVFAHAADEMPAQGGLTVFGSYKNIGEFANQFDDVGVAIDTFVRAINNSKVLGNNEVMSKFLAKDGPFDNVITILKAMNKLSKSLDPSNGVEQIGTGNTTLSEFGIMLTGLTTGLTDFVTGIDILSQKVDLAEFTKKAGVFEQVLTILTKLNNVTKEIVPTGGGKDLVMGSQSLNVFMMSISGLPTMINGFIARMKEVDTEDLSDFVTNKLPLVETLISSFGNLAKTEIPTQGGFMSWIEGQQDLGNFGAQLRNFAFGFVSMAQELETWTPEDGFIDKIDTIKTAATELNSIEPPSQTLIEAFSAWAKNELQYSGIEKLLKVLYIINNSEILPDDIDINSKVEKLATAANSLSQIKPTSSGFFEAIHDWSTQDVVNGGIIRLAGAVKTIALTAPTSDPTQKISMLAKASTELNKIKTTDDGFFETIRKWAANQVNVAGVKHLADAINEINEKSKGIKTGNISKLSTAATKVKEAVSIFEGMGSVPSGTNLVKLAENVAKFAGKIGNAKTSGLADKASAVVDSVNNLKGVTSAAASVKSASSSLVSAGKSLTSGYAKGISSGYSSVTSAVKSLTKGAKNAVDTSALYSVGKNVGKSLAKGMRDALPDCKAAADKLVEQAEKAAKAKAEINSPSKVFMRIGAGLGEGFVMGINSFSNKVYSASANMASHSIEAANEALNSLDTAVNPTITPVLDLSEIQRGANQINALISQNEAINLSANMNNIPSRYATPGMLSQMYNKMYDPKSAIGVKLDDAVGNTNYFNITVDGTEDPEQFANTFVHRMEMLMSMGG